MRQLFVDGLTSATNKSTISNHINVIEHFWKFASEWNLSLILVIKGNDNSLIHWGFKSCLELFSSSFNLVLMLVPVLILANIIDCKCFFEILNSHVKDSIISNNQFCLLFEFISPSIII